MQGDGLEDEGKAVCYEELITNHKPSIHRQSDEVVVINKFQGPAN
jgi:hypothetical protein